MTRPASSSSSSASVSASESLISKGSSSSSLLERNCVRVWVWKLLDMLMEGVSPMVFLRLLPLGLWAGSISSPIVFRLSPLAVLDLDFLVTSSSGGGATSAASSASRSSWSSSSASRSINWASWETKFIWVRVSCCKVLRALLGRPYVLTWRRRGGKCFCLGAGEAAVYVTFFAESPRSPWARVCTGIFGKLQRNAPLQIRLLCICVW